jgi:hypothetical protein
MTTSQTELSGLPLALFILQEVSKQAINCTVVPANRTPPIEKYPVVTYNIVIPETETTGDWLEDERQYTSVVQLDIHSTRQIEAMTLAQSLYEALHDTGYIRFFKQVNILPQQITNVSNRTVLTAENYDQDFGFDCSFLINGTKKYDTSQLDFEYSKTDILSVHGVDNIEGTTFDTSKSDKN